MTVVFSLGGSLIAPDGIDTRFLAGFRRVMQAFVRRGNRAIIICGGGQTSRAYTDALKRLMPGVDAATLDWLGIAATQLNAVLVRDLFGQSAEPRILYNPTQKIRTSKRIIVGSGWRPGCSSDKDAVLAARTYGVSTVVNLSNIDYVYDRDPKRFTRAKPMPSLTWLAFQKIVGRVWQPGAHAPFDPVAARLARRWSLRLVVMRGGNLENLQAFLTGRAFRGTVIGKRN